VAHNRPPGAARSAAPAARGAAGRGSTSAGRAGAVGGVRGGPDRAWNGSADVAGCGGSLGGLVVAVHGAGGVVDRGGGEKRVPPRADRDLPCTPGHRLSVAGPHREHQPAGIGADRLGAGVEGCGRSPGQRCRVPGVVDEWAGGVGRRAELARCLVRRREAAGTSHTPPDGSLMRPTAKSTTICFAILVVAGQQAAGAER